MRLLFDLLATQPHDKGSKYHGGGEYAKVVFKELVQQGYSSSMDCLFTSKKEMDEGINIICKEYNITMIDVCKIPSIKEYIENSSYNVFYSALPFDFYSEINFNETKFIFTIHGLRTLEMPTDSEEFFFCKNRRDLLIYFYKNIFSRRYFNKKYSDIKNLLKVENKRLFVASNHTKYSLLSFFSELDPDVIEVFYSPTSIIPINIDIEQKISKEIESKSYFLLISGDRWLKNNRRAVFALDKLFSNKAIDDKKVLVLGVNNLKPYKDIVNKERFIFKEYVSKDELEIYYKHAFTFIYPTLNEGFGYPPIEAMKYRTPVISSCISSIYEVCKDSVLYFNPYSIDELKNRILMLYHDENIREQLAQKGYDNFTHIKQKQAIDLSNMVKVITDQRN